MANEMTATKPREYPEFPCEFEDAHGNRFSCDSAATFESLEQMDHLTLVTAPKKKATKKKASKKKASKK